MKLSHNWTVSLSLFMGFALLGFLLGKAFQPKPDLRPRQSNEVHIVGCGLNALVEVPEEGESIVEFLERVPIPRNVSAIQLLENSKSYHWGNTLIELENGEIPTHLTVPKETTVLAKRTIWLYGTQSSPE